MAPPAAECPDDDAALHSLAPPPRLSLAWVQLTEFKVFRSAAVGPFHPEMTCVVGPNGTPPPPRIDAAANSAARCGKSCLLEGICFTLGLESGMLRASSLSGLVNHAAQNGACAAAVGFSAAAAGAAAAHDVLVVQRRVLNGKRSEWRVQECRCATARVAPATPSEGVPAADACWCCSRCAVRVVSRDAMQDLLLHRLGIDTRRPESFVVQQSTSLQIAQKAPLELLHFLEAFAGTVELRERAEAESTIAASHRAELEEAERLHDAAAATRIAHAAAMEDLGALEAQRGALEASKARLLACEVRTRRTRSSAEQATLAGAERALADADAERAEASARARELSARRGKERRAHAAAEQSLVAARKRLAEAKDALVAHGLERKKAGAAARRREKSAAAATKAAQASVDAERAAQFELAEATREAREAAEKAEREAGALDACERERPARGTDGAVRALERELREIERRHPADGPAAEERPASPRAKRPRTGAAQDEPASAARVAAQAAEAASRAAAAAAITAAAAVDDEAKRTRAWEASWSARARLAARVDAARARAAELEASVSSAAARASDGARLSAIGAMRAADTHVCGLLCECLGTADEHAAAVNAVIAGALRMTVVVATKRAAVALIGRFARDRVGIATCLILDELPPPPRARPPAPPAGVVPLAPCVRCDARYARVVHRLFDGWYLADDKQAALRATRARRLNVVTRGGECFYSSGEIRSAPAASAEPAVFRLRETPRPLCDADGPSGAASDDAACTALSRARAQLGESAGALKLAAAAEIDARDHLERARDARVAAEAEAAALRTRASESLAVSEAIAAAVGAARTIKEAESAPPAPATACRELRLAELAEIAPEAAERHRRWCEAASRVRVTEHDHGAAQLVLTEATARATRRARERSRLAAQAEQSRAEAERAKTQERALATSAGAPERAEAEASSMVGAAEERGALAASAMREAECLAAAAIESRDATAAVCREKQRARDRAGDALRASRDAIAALLRQQHTARAAVDGDDGDKSDGCDDGDQSDDGGASLEAARLALRAGETAFEKSVRSLNLDGAQAFLDASAEAEAHATAAAAARSKLDASLRRVETLTSRRHSLLAEAMAAMNGRLRDTFGALCEHGDCSLEYSDQALVAVALQLSLHPPGASPLALFDEIDAALDTKKTSALVELIRSRTDLQSVFVSHRQPLIEGANALVGAYAAAPTSSRTVTLWRR